MTENEKLVQSTIREGRAVLCAAGNQRLLFESQGKGIQPLLTALEQKEVFRRSSLDWGDKLVGRAAAFLLVLLCPRSVFAATASSGALDILKHAGIPCSCDALIPIVLTPDRTKLCPMEEAVRNLEDPLPALVALQKKVAEMNCARNTVSYPERRIR